MDVSDASADGRSSSPITDGSSTIADPVVDADREEDVNVVVAAVVMVVVAAALCFEEMARERSSGNIFEDCRRKLQARNTNAEDNVGNISTQ